MGYFSDAVRGISWMGLFRLVTRIMAILKTVILARVLLPVQFGVYGIATLVLGLLEMLTETGINVFLIQDEAKVHQYVNTAWVISIIRGALISLVIIISTPLVIWFFKVPQALPLLLLISLVPLIRGFINPSVVRLQKDLRFKEEFFFRTSVFFIDAVVAILLALKLRSPISLVWGLLAGVVWELGLSFYWLKPRPKFKFHLGRAKTIINLGKWITLTGVLDYFSTKGADIVVGKLLNPTALGIFQMSYKISVQNIQEITDLFNRVSFPIYAKIAGDKQRLARAFKKKYLTVLCLVTIPSLGLFFFPELIIRILLGPNWLAAVPVLRLMAVFGLIRSVVSPISPLFLAYKKQIYLALLSLVSVIVLSIVIVPLTFFYGNVGATSALIITTLMVSPLTIWLFNRLFSLRKIEAGT